MKTIDKNGQLRGVRRYKGTHIIKCSICGKEFKCYICEKNRKYCSPQCYQKSPTRGKRPENKRTEKCEYCGKAFTRPAANFRAKAHNFCSHSCSALWWADYGLHGEEHPHWMGGYSQKEYRDGWTRIKKEIKNRAGGKCEKCGGVHKCMDVHHIKPVRLKLDINIANHVDNLQYLCRPCHIVADRILRQKE